MQIDGKGSSRRLPGEPGGQSVSTTLGGPDRPPTGLVVSQQDEIARSEPARRWCALAALDRDAQAARRDAKNGAARSGRANGQKIGRNFKTASPIAGSTPSTSCRTRSTAIWKISSPSSRRGRSPEFGEATEAPPRCRHPRGTRRRPVPVTCLKLDPAHALVRRATHRRARRDAVLLHAGLRGGTLAEGLRVRPDPRRQGFRNARGSVARRAAGVPLAYLTGTRDFYGRPFHVTPAVLIPRPETELVVDEALSELDANGWSPGGARPLGVDVGTGSGCLAITLALERPGLDVIATDAPALSRLQGARGPSASRASASSNAPPPPLPAAPRLIVSIRRMCRDRSRHAPLEVRDHERSGALRRARRARCHPSACPDRRPHTGARRLPVGNRRRPPPRSPPHRNNAESGADRIARPSVHPAGHRRHQTPPRLRMSTPSCPACSAESSRARFRRRRCEDDRLVAFNDINPQTCTCSSPRQHIATLNDLDSSRRPGRRNSGAAAIAAERGFAEGGFRAGSTATPRRVDRVPHPPACGRRPTRGRSADAAARGGFALRSSNQFVLAVRDPRG